MATKVQSKTYFPGSMMDLNNGLCNNMWDIYHDDMTSGSQKSQYYDSILMSQTMDGYPGYAKEQMRQTIMKQDSIFRHQIYELHRLYKRQKDLMNEFATKQHYDFLMPTEAPNSSHFLSQISSRNSKDMQSIFSSSTSLKGKSTLHEFGPLSSKSSTTQRRVIDLELPADVDDDNNVKNVHNLSTGKAYNLADLNEPIQVEEAPFSASFGNKNSDLWHKKEQPSYSYFDGKSKIFNNGYGNSIFSHHSNLLQTEPKKPLENLSKKRTIFGVDLCETSHTPSSDSSTLHHNNHWLGSSDSSSKTQENRLPPWLMTKSNLCNEQSKGKETMVYQMNLDSLQHHSQQFFKKAETTKNVHDLNVKVNNSQEIPKILGVPIFDVHESSKNCYSKLRNQIDLNLTFEEEETPYIPESVVKIASMEIDLESPVLESETDSPETIDADEERVKSAAEAILVISSSKVIPPPQQTLPPGDTMLRWFVEVIFNNDEELIPEGMDYLEYKTLKLEETQEYNCIKPMVLEEKEDDESSLPKRATKKGNGKRGRQRKDFQRDVLPGIVTLSRREVNEDLQVFEEAFSGIGVSWESSLSKRKAANKNGRGRRRLVVADQPPSPPPPPPPPPVAAVEQISGWGKRTRRLPRQRCQNGGSHQSLALKC